MSFFDIFLPPEAQAVQELITQGCDASTLGPMTARVDDVRNNWKPSGFYTPDQLGQIVTLALETTTGATTAIQQALGVANIDSHKKLLLDANDAQTPVNQEAMTFVTALQQARAGGFTVIEAQGLRRWVIRMLEAANEAHRAVSVVSCARPGILDTLQGLSDAIVKFCDFITAVVGVAVDVAKAAGNLLLKIPDFVSSLVKFAKILPWVALAFGGYYVAVKTEIIPSDPLRLRGRQTFKPWKRAGEP